MVQLHSGTAIYKNAILRPLFCTPYGKTHYFLQMKMHKMKTKQTASELNFHTLFTMFQLHNVNN